MTVTAKKRKLASDEFVSAARLEMSTGTTTQDAATHLVEWIERVVIDGVTPLSTNERCVLKGMYKLACLFAKRRPALYVRDFGVKND